MSFYLGLAIKNEKHHIEELIQDTNYRFDTWLEKAEHLLSFAETAKQQFEIGTLETKLKIIQTLGSNLYLTDRILSIELAEPLELIKGVAPDVCAVLKLEPVEEAQNDGKKGLERCFLKNGGDEGTRTLDLLRDRQAF